MASTSSLTGAVADSERIKEVVYEAMKLSNREVLILILSRVTVR